MSSPATEPELPAPGAAPDDEPTAWPDESAEAAFLSEAKARGDVIAPSATKERLDDSDDADEQSPLPPLEQAVARVPRDVREILEDLFRARFVGVKRVPKNALKK